MSVLAGLHLPCPSPGKPARSASECPSPWRPRKRALARASCWYKPQRACRKYGHAPPAHGGPSVKRNKSIGTQRPGDTLPHPSRDKQEDGLTMPVAEKPLSELSDAMTQHSPV